MEDALPMVELNDLKGPFHVSSVEFGVSALGAGPAEGSVQFGVTECPVLGQEGSGGAGECSGKGTELGRVRRARKS